MSRFVATNVKRLRFERLESRQLLTALYYVSTTGSDSNPGTFSQPLRTLEAAYDLMPNNVGGTIVLMGGEYDDAMDGWGWSKSGTANSPLVVESYPGQRAIVTNEIPPAAWTNTAPGIWYCSPGRNCLVIPLADRPAVQANTQSDFTAPAPPLADSHGNLLYNLSWYDASTGDLWFRSPALTDPTSQVVLAPAGSQFSIDPSSNYQFLNIDFRYCGFFHQQAGGTHTNTVISGCTFKYMEAGIVGGAVGGVYSDNWIDDVGPALMWVAAWGEYSAPNLDQGLYLNGSDCTVSDNIVSRVECGSAVQFYPYGLADSMISNNVILDCAYGGTLMGSGWTFTNNTVMNVDGIGPYLSAQDFQITNNYFEGADLLGMTSISSSMDFTGGFQISGNTFNTGTNPLYPVSICLSGTWDTADSLVDGNTYMGPFRAQYWTPDLQESVYSTLSAWQAAVQAIPGCSSWESHSTFSTQQESFDPAQLTQILDDDTAAEITQIISAYRATATSTSNSDTATWTSTSGSAWSGPANWTDDYAQSAVPGIAPRPGNTDMAAFNGAGSVTAIDLTGVNPGMQVLDFSTSNYTLSGGGLRLNSDSGTATVAVSSSTQTIASSTALTLASTADMAIGASSELVINADIGESGGSQSLLKDGAGTLVLGGSDNTYSGGTVVDAGTLIVAAPAALPSGGALTVGVDGTLFDPSAAGAPRASAGVATDAPATESIAAAASTSDAVTASACFNPRQVLVAAGGFGSAGGTSEMPVERTASAAAKARDAVLSGTLDDSASSAAAWLWGVLDAPNQKNWDLPHPRRLPKGGK